ncbi:hypothetical protein PanWU01x14_242340, partial [Parasponia andersonii]
RKRESEREPSCRGKNPVFVHGTEGEIPVAIDVQSRRRKSIFRIVRSSLIGNQKVLTD